MNGKLIDFRGDDVSPESLKQKEQLESQLTAIFKKDVKVNFIQINSKHEGEQDDIRKA